MILGIVGSINSFGMSLASLLQVWVRRPSQIDRQITRIRSLDFTGHSDAELKEELVSLKNLACDDDFNVLMTKVFAIVNETMSRRLGAWRLFDLEHDVGTLARYREIADKVIHEKFSGSLSDYYEDRTFSETLSSTANIGSMLSKMDLDSDGRVIVEAIVYVTEKRRFTYTSDIMMPARFYRSVSLKDSDNVLSLTITNEQVKAGLLLYRGTVVEMAAGEGKTFAAALSAVLHAVLGHSVHVITANDYLASRDAEWLAPVYEALGLDVRTVLGHMDDEERKYSYRGDIIYGTLREFGFDFLRDNLRYSVDNLVQGPLEVAIVDEADQVMIDEARTPLIISGQPSGDTGSAHKVKGVVELMITRQDEVVSGLLGRSRCNDNSSEEQVNILAAICLASPENSELTSRISSEERLRRRVLATAYSILEDIGCSSTNHGLYFAIDTRNEVIVLTSVGQQFVERHLGPIFDTISLEVELQCVESAKDSPLAERRLDEERIRRRLSRRHSQMNQVQQTLRAYLLLKRGVDYVIKGGDVVLVDSLTGRVTPDTKYQDGLHAALQAKEGVFVHPVAPSLAQVSVQGFMKEYSLLAGMTGTALISATEFGRVYGLDVISLPPALATKRWDIPTRLYRSRKDKLRALVDQVKLSRTVGRPALVCAPTVEKSEEISELFTLDGIQHKVLNAVANISEEEVVAGAGNFGAVTVATNMAGRGTDICIAPGLEKRIIDGYVEIIRDLLSDRVSEVAVSCANSDEAGILQSALDRLDQISVSRHCGSGVGWEVLVSAKDTSRSGQIDLEFGLGLNVISTEINESSRVDAQIRGRAGRQGEHGTSRLIMSQDDSVLVYGYGSCLLSKKDSKTDWWGRVFSEGRSAARWISNVQTAVEGDNETSRSFAFGYDRAVEGQYLAYCRIRREVMQATSFYVVCSALMRERARRLVDYYIRPAVNNPYGCQFDSMSEELLLDYQLDVDHLRGCGVEAIKFEIERLMILRLEMTKSYLGDKKFDETAKRLFLRTGDDLWVGHLSSLHDMMVSISLCARDHRDAIAEYVFRSAEVYGRFKEDITDVFLPKLCDFECHTNQSNVPRNIALVHDIQKILV